MSNLNKYFKIVYLMDIALSHMYSAMHWKSSGGNYYSDHLLYQRLYEGASAEIDVLAEKFIGITDDPSTIAPVSDIQMVAKILSDFVSDDDRPEGFANLAIAAEKKFMAAIDALLSEEVSNGVEDMMQGIYSKHEEHMYLLQQRNKTAGVIDGLIKIADELDKAGCYEDVDELDLMIQSMLERVGLK